ncbi:SDR family oxidoreductase [Pedobacter sp. SAFR-022]|uniref:SDR family oxidoreductase n=1 Tax=Pedobacter sp. SAFR-022 TaxID=3436861 RepID=UPI003F80164F
MVKEFEGRGFWAVVLGGSSGLGLASAIKLAEQGMNICLIHRNSRTQMEAIEASFRQIRAFGVSLTTFNLDVTRSESRDIVIKKLAEVKADTGRVRCLLHSIAKGNLKSLSGPENALGTEDFLLTMQNMAISLSDWTAALHQAGLFADDARVISFTSEGSSRAWKYYAAVSAAKAALEAITRSIALEYAPFGIRANCIQAGVTDTLSLRKIPGSEALKTHSINRNPFNRLTTPEDVAKVVYLLCKDEAAWINGVVLPVDGGEQIS